IFVFVLDDGEVSRLAKVIHHLGNRRGNQIHPVYTVFGLVNSKVKFADVRGSQCPRELPDVICEQIVLEFAAERDLFKFPLWEATEIVAAVVFVMPDERGFDLTEQSVMKGRLEFDAAVVENYFLFVADNVLHFRYPIVIVVGIVAKWAKRQALILIAAETGA